MRRGRCGGMQHRQRRTTSGTPRKPPARQPNTTSGTNQHNRSNTRDVHRRHDWRLTHVRAHVRRLDQMLGPQPQQRSRTGVAAERAVHCGERRQVPHVRAAHRRHHRLLGREQQRPERRPERTVHRRHHGQRPFVRPAHERHHCLLGLELQRRDRRAERRIHRGRRSRPAHVRATRLEGSPSGKDGLTRTAIRCCGCHGDRDGDVQIEDRGALCLPLAAVNPPIPVLATCNASTTIPVTIVRCAPVSTRARRIRRSVLRVSGIATATISRTRLSSTETLNVGMEDDYCSAVVRMPSWAGCSPIFWSEKLPVPNTTVDRAGTDPACAR